MISLNSFFLNLAEWSTLGLSLILFNTRKKSYMITLLIQLMISIGIINVIRYYSTSIYVYNFMNMVNGIFNIILLIVVQQFKHIGDFLMIIPTHGNVKKPNFNAISLESLVIISYIGAKSYIYTYSLPQYNKLLDILILSYVMIPLNKFVKTFFEGKSNLEHPKKKTKIKTILNKTIDKFYERGTNNERFLMNILKLINLGINISMVLSYFTNLTFLMILIKILKSYSLVLLLQLIFAIDLYIKNKMTNQVKFKYLIPLILPSNVKKQEFKNKDAKFVAI